MEMQPLALSQLCRKNLILLAKEGDANAARAETVSRLVYIRRAFGI